AGATLRACAVGFVKRDRHAITDLDRAHVTPNLLHDAADLVSGIGGEREVEPHPCQVLIPKVPVAATNAACLYADDRAIGPRRRDRKLDHLNWTTEFRQLRHTHGPDEGPG